MKKTIKAKANTFRYPSLEERQKINSITSKIERLNIEYKSATINILQNSPFETAIKDEDTYWWCNCLNNRIGKMEETYLIFFYFWLPSSRKKNLTASKL